MHVLFRLVLLVTVVANPLVAAPLVVQRLAGTGSAGHADGAAQTASFFNPVGIAVDSAGNVFVCDGENHAIRKIARGGTVTTVAGTVGQPGARDGVGLNAQFTAPNSIAIDSGGNLFVTDNGNHAVRRISVAGEVTTFAGQLGVSGAADGTGNAARFFAPHGIAVDANDNVFVADVANQAIRKITPSRVVTTFAGALGVRGDVNGTGATARFNFPSGLAIDRDGNVWVSSNETIRRITPAGVVSTIAGQAAAAGYVDGAAASARFDGPEGLAFGERGELYIAEIGNEVIRVLEPSLQVSTAAGTAHVTGLVDGIGAAVKFNNPIGLATGPGSRLYITDSSNHVIRAAVPSDLVPDVQIATPSQDATISNGWPVRLRSEAFTFDCSAVPTDVSRGGWQLLVDGAVAAQFCSGFVILPALSPGQHQIGVRLTSSDGTLLRPTVEKTVTLTVRPDPQFQFSSLLTGQASVAGSGGSFFRSSAWLVNPSAEAAVVRLTLTPGAGFAGVAARNAVVVTIPPRQMLAFRDVLSEVFLVQAATAGTISVELGSGSPAPIITARTYNDTSTGTFGQYIQSNRTSSTEPILLEGLSNDAASRTNLGVVNFTATSINSTITLLGADGAQIGNTIERTVPPRSFLQINSVTSAAGVSAAPLFAARVAASDRFTAYASRLDNVTSDPIFIIPLQPRTEQWIDGVGAVPGVGGTFFRSLLVLANRNSADATVHLRYIERGSSSPSTERDVAIPAGASLAIADVAGQLLNRSGTVGYLSLTSNVPVVAWVRTYNDRGSEGTFGQFIPAFSVAELFPTTGAILSGVTEDASFRTNFGAVNVSGARATITVTAIRDDGVRVAEKTYGIEAGQAIFVGRILNDIGAQGGGSFYLQIVPSAPNAIYTWASYVDNRSTDQTFVRPIVMDPF